MNWQDKFIKVTDISGPPGYETVRYINPDNILEINVHNAVTCIITKPYYNPENNYYPNYSIKETPEQLFKQIHDRQFSNKMEKMLNE